MGLNGVCDNDLSNAEVLLISTSDLVCLIGRDTITHFVTVGRWRTLTTPCSWRGLFLLKHAAYTWFIAIFPPFHRLSSIPPPHYLLSTFLLLPASLPASSSSVFILKCSSAKGRKSRSRGIWKIHKVKTIPPPTSFVHTWIVGCWSPAWMKCKTAEAYEVQW